MSISPRSDENNGFHFLTQAHGAGLKQSWEMSSSSSLSITAVCFLLFSSLFSSNVTYLRHRTSNQGAQHPSLADKNFQVRSSERLGEARTNRTHSKQLSSSRAPALASCRCRLKP